MRTRSALREILRRVPFARSAYRAVVNQTALLVNVAPSGRLPCRVAFYPRFTQAAEFLDAYYKAAYFLPKRFVSKITMAVAPSVEVDVSRPSKLPRPDYLANGLSDTERFVIIRGSNWSTRYWMELAQSDFVFVWDWQAVRGHALSRFWKLRLRNIDRHANTWDGWTWARFCFSLLPVSEKGQVRAEARERFRSYVERLPRHSRTYLFGTGPSLESAYDFDFSDGYRVVCNTIVRNRALIEHIKPHFIVAGDAIYHFGNTRHAFQFREDLERILYSSEAVFLTTDYCALLLSQHSPKISERTIPTRTDCSGISLDLRDYPVYTNLPNILNGLLLPLGSSLSNEVYLLGFDGRVASDQLFWKNSEANSYGVLKETIMAAHPGFFKGINYEEYAAKQSENAEKVMTLGEAMGKSYSCLNRTSIPALQKRMVGRTTRGRQTYRQEPDVRPPSRPA